NRRHHRACIVDWRRRLVHENGNHRAAAREGDSLVGTNAVARIDSSNQLTTGPSHVRARSSPAQSCSSGVPGMSTRLACDDRRKGDFVPLPGHFPYKNSGNQSVMPGQIYMNTRQMSTMNMYGIMPAKIWLSVTCLGETPLR